MTKHNSYGHEKIFRAVLPVLMLVPAVSSAYELNMPQFGRTVVPVTETIQFYDLKGTSSITSSTTNNSLSTVVFTPAAEDEAVQISFSRISLIGDGASYPTSLAVVNGNYDEDFTYPETTSGVTATGFPDNGNFLKYYFSDSKTKPIEEENVTFTSTAPDGSLSVCFHYRYAANCEGWEAVVRSVKLVDMDLQSVTADYPVADREVYGGKKDIRLGSLTVGTEGLLNPYSLTSVSFDLDDKDAIFCNLTLTVNGVKVTSEPEVNGSVYTYRLDNVLESGDNVISVSADIAPDAKFYASGSLRFTGVATDAPSTPVIEGGTPEPVNVVAMVMMPADGSHITAEVGEEASVSFYDNGGPEAGYPLNSSGTVTFRPQPGAEGKVMIDFSNIDLFNTFPTRNDVLEVYSGTEADPENLLITLLTEKRARVRSTSPDGALTVYFATTTGVGKSGWEATASLFTPQPMELTATRTLPMSDATVKSGEKEAGIIRYVLTTENTEPAMLFNSLSIDLCGTSSQWERASLYYTGNNAAFSASTATKVAEIVVSGDLLDMTADAPFSLCEGENNFWVIADVREDAESGTRLDAAVRTVTLNGASVDGGEKDSDTGREVYNLYYPLATPTEAHVYGAVDFAHEPYSTYYTGYDGVNKEKRVTFIPGHDGHVCQIDFSLLNLYYSTSSYSKCTPEFKIYAGTEVVGEPIYVHQADLNFKSGEEALVPVIRSTSPDGALTVVFNAQTLSSSTSYSRSAGYGFKAVVSEYLSRPMTVTAAQGVHSGLGSVSLSSALNVPAVGVAVTVDGNLDPMTMDEVAFSLKGDAGAITGVRLAVAPGTVFDAEALRVVAEGEINGADVVFELNEVTSEGTFTYWLLCDVDADSAPGSVIDASVSRLVIGSLARNVTNADPEGEIITVNSYDPVVGDKEQILTVGEYPVVINGVTAAYVAGEYTVTVVPATEGDKVTATFTEGSFNPNAAYQYVTVIGGAEAFGVDSNTVYPVSITSAREDGSLTIEYHSMTVARPEGWKCTVSCDSRKPLVMQDFNAVMADDIKATAGSVPLVYGFGFDVKGDKDPISITGFSLDMENAADIFSSLELYATSGVAAFSGNNLVATLDDMTDGSIMLSEPFVISSEGKQHFWLRGVLRRDVMPGMSCQIRPSVILTESGSVALGELPSVGIEVVQGFHGTYTVGTSENADYADFASVVADMKVGVDGPVTILVEPGRYEGNVELDNIGGVSSVNSITISGLASGPDGVVICSDRWSAPPYSDDQLEYYYGVFTLRGTSYVTLRNLTVSTENISFPSVIHVAGGASDLEIDNCVIEAPISNNNYYNVCLLNCYVSPSAAQLTERVTVRNSDLRGGYVGVKFGSATMNQPESESITIDGCQFSGQGFQSIYLSFAKDVAITDNSFYGTSQADDKNYCQVVDLDISGPARIERNHIEYVKTGTYALYLRRLEGTPEAPVVIANNIIDIDALGYIGAGINLYNSNRRPMTAFTIAYNNVNVCGEQPSVALGINLRAETEVNGLIANNIFRNETSGYVIKEQFGPSGVTFSHNVGHTATGGYAYWGGTYDKAMTVEEWAQASGDNAALDMDVPFDRTNSFLPLCTRTLEDLRCGVVVPGVDTDYTGTARDGSVTTVGAYEYSIYTGVDEIDTVVPVQCRVVYDTLDVSRLDGIVSIYSYAGNLLLRQDVTGLDTIDLSDLPRGFCIMAAGNETSRLILR